jgi:hypothetical protein
VSSLVASVSIGFEWSQALKTSFDSPDFSTQVVLGRLGLPAGTLVIVDGHWKDLPGMKDTVSPHCIPEYIEYRGTRVVAPKTKYQDLWVRGFPWFGPDHAEIRPVDEKICRYLVYEAIASVGAPSEVWDYTGGPIAGNSDYTIESELIVRDEMGTEK